MNPLVLKSHKDSPAGVIPPNTAALIEPRVVLNHLADHGVGLSAVLCHRGHCRPILTSSAEVIPRHLVHTRLKEGLKEEVDPIVEQSSNPELVDVEDGRVAVVKDLWVAELVVGLADKRISALEAGKEDLCESPCVVKVVKYLLPREVV